MNISVEMKDIEFSYSRSEDLISIKDLSIISGEKVFIHGPSGSGKSTFLNLIAGVIKPDAGTLNVMGHNIKALTMSQTDKPRGDNIGFVFQNFNLIPYLTIYENILLPLKSSKKSSLKLKIKLIMRSEEFPNI